MALGTKKHISINERRNSFDIRIKSNLARQDLIFSTVPGDKSISQRAVILNAIANGTGVVRNVLKSDDIENCIRSLQLLGVQCTWDRDDLFIEGVGLSGLKQPQCRLEIGNTATSARLLLSILGGSPFNTELSGNPLLSKRPMDWVGRPLIEMGAKINYMERTGCLPLEVTGAYPLNPIHVDATVASAQEKSAILFAGLFSNGTTSYKQLCQSRDHTERLMQYFGIDIDAKEQITTITGGKAFDCKEVIVPGDMSSAAFLLSAYAIRRKEHKGHLLIKDIGVNPTRLGFVNELQKRGMNISLEKQRMLVSNEPVADLFCTPGRTLSTGHVEGVEFVQSLIDEVPLLAAISAFTDGISVIKDCSELQDKDTNRLETTAMVLSRFGIEVTCDSNEIMVVGGKPLTPAIVDSCGDHRIAMMAAVVASSMEEPSIVRNCGCISVSYPTFLEDLSRFADIEVLN
ncbi:3-phosphoshikimate 1-carboxyvinyltransferase [Paenibacillus fonticola]|uniref:3-phosphoshikimate 1-carboxyvinyltransferase n=1 Tax=Paenibacillus fonticola TaxID=379896 RepID=UPI00036DDDA9|nr:3-phosphoshikimate 1-carboxyvinyltransferase [Paenibacillus fonticola]